MVKPSQKYLCGPTFCRVLVKVLDKIKQKKQLQPEFIYIVYIIVILIQMFKKKTAHLLFTHVV